MPKHKKTPPIITIYAESSAVAALTLQAMGATGMIRMQDDSWHGRMPNGAHVIGRADKGTGVDNGRWTIQY